MPGGEQVENKHFYVYGDPAYRLSLYILRGYKGARSRLQAIFSILMNKLRVSVEWGFGHVVQDWTYLDKKKNMKLHKMHVGKLFYVGALLTNIKSCVTASHVLDGYGNKIAKKLKCKPPSLHDYLHRF